MPKRGGFCTREADHSILFGDGRNSLLCCFWLSVAPRQRILLSNFIKLSVQSSGLSSILLNGLPTVSPERIFVKWVDVNRKADRMNATNVYQQ